MQRFLGIGNICNDLELRYTSNDKAVLRFTLAIKRDFKNTNNEYESDFIQCVAFNKTAEYMSKYLKKGNKIAISGNIRTGSYEKEGNKVYTTEVYLDSVENLTPIEKEDKTKKESKLDEDVFAKFGESIEVSDNDLPF